MKEMHGRGLVSFGVLLLTFTAVVDCAECEDGDIRYDPDNLDKLVIQVCVDSDWGYVCGHEDTFSKQDVAVACNQLGFKPDENSYAVALFDEKIDGFLSIRAIYCTGLENRLIDCPIHNNYGTTSSCKKSGLFYYAAVNCTYDEIECINGEIKDGPNGILEICVYGDWYPLCGDLDGWNHQDAETACRNLGENPQGAKSLSLKNSDYPEAYNLRFHCSGSESLLVDCPKSLITSCDDDLLATINCGDTIDTDRPMQPSIIDVSVTHSQLTITWSGSIQYQYEVSCTSNSINNVTVYYETLTTRGADTAMFSYILPNTQYNCCVVSQFEDIASEPFCQVINVGKDEQPISSTAASATVSVSSTMSSNRNDFFESYSLSIYGFVAGLFVGAVIMMVMCGCVLIVCRIKHKRQKSKYPVAENFVSINSDAQELHHSNNPLYGSDRYNNNDYEPENLLKPQDEYAYIDRRPPVPVPSEQITPYHTTVASNQAPSGWNHVNNRSKD